MVVERLDGVDRVIPVRQCVCPRTHYFAAGEQAVSIYSSSALVKSFARIALKRAPTVGQRKKRCLQSPQ
jgi:hypothetical protein